MAQTLKFGSGTWATKKGSTLAYNDEDGNFKPLPFTYTGAGKGTRVNKKGLIEVVENDRPRIDYKDSENGVFLLEKAATNSVPYSEDINNNAWSKVSLTVSPNEAISPNGSLNADKLTENTTTSQHRISDIVSLVSGQEHTISAFVKPNGSKWVRLRLENASIGSGQINVWFDLENGIVGTEGAGVGKIEKYPNGWYRCSATGTTNTTVNVCIVALADADGSSSYAGDTSRSSYVWGVSVENSSYLTSYIPTQGSIQTRVAETASGSGNSEVFNDSQGVLFADISALANDGTARRISMSDGSSSNNIYLSYRATANQVRANISGSYDKTITISDTLLYNKLLIKYKSGDISFWINGFEVDTSTSGISINGLNTLNFDGGLGFQDFYGKTKEIAYYDEILTDLELETLTSYRSWLSMVKELNLNVIYNG